MEMKTNGAGFLLFSLADEPLTDTIVCGDLLARLRFHLYMAEANRVGRAGWTIDHVTAIADAVDSTKLARNLKFQ